MSVKRLLRVCLSAVFLVVFGFYLYWTLMDAMEQTDFHPLNIVLAHFKEVRARAYDLSVDVRTGKRTTYCSLRWLTFDVGGPPDRALSSPHYVKSGISFWVGRETHTGHEK